MGRRHIEHHATTSGDPATVYALLREGASRPSWSPIDAFELERHGESEPEGVGAVRVLRSGRVTGRDTIVELVPDRRLSYTHTSSLPVRDYRGDIDLTPVAGGTEIRWATSFEPKYPGTGGLCVAASTDSSASARRVSRRARPSSGSSTGCGGSSPRAGCSRSARSCRAAGARTPPSARGRSSRTRRPS